MHTTESKTKTIEYLRLYSWLKNDVTAKSIYKLVLKITLSSKLCNISHFIL